MVLKNEHCVLKYASRFFSTFFCSLIFLLCLQYDQISVYTDWPLPGSVAPPPSRVTPHPLTTARHAWKPIILSPARNRYFSLTNGLFVLPCLTVSSACRRLTSAKEVDLQDFFLKIIPTKHARYVSLVIFVLRFSY